MVFLESLSTTRCGRSSESLWVLAETLDGNKLITYWNWTIHAATTRAVLDSPMTASYQLQSFTLRLQSHQYHKKVYPGCFVRQYPNGVLRKPSGACLVLETTFYRAYIVHFGLARLAAVIYTQTKHPGHLMPQVHSFIMFGLRDITLLVAFLTTSALAQGSTSEQTEAQITGARRLVLTPRSSLPAHPSRSSVRCHRSQ